MKKLIIVWLFFLPIALTAQQLQLHYDFSNDREYLTTTLEMFRPDSLGSTFFFVDFDFNLPGSPRSMSAAYWEIAREFYIPGLRNNPLFDQLTFHVEYNDGFTAYKIAGDTLGAASYNSVFLTGFGHPLRIGKLILSTQWLCRMPRGMDKPDFQFTLVWYQPVFSNRLLLTGYADFWSQDKMANPDRKELAFQAEPQLWFLLNPHLALGGEVEISKNFPVGPNDWEFRPTLGLRWEF